MNATYVITNKNQILVQAADDDSQFGFSLHDDDQTWPGGLGIAAEWTAIDRDDPRITPEDHARLDWLLDG